MTIYLDNSMDDYHIYGMIVYISYNLTNLDLIPAKLCHVPLPKIRSTGMWQWPVDTHEEWNLFHEYLRLSITSRIAHIYAYIIMCRDKKHIYKILNHKQYHSPYLNKRSQEKKLNSPENNWTRICSMINSLYRLSDLDTEK